MKSLTCWMHRALGCTLGCALLSVLFPPLLSAQSPQVLSVGEIQAAHVKRNETFTQKVDLELKEGFHVNSNTPVDIYLIPFRLRWVGGPLDTEQISYPKATMQKSAFSEKPISVFSGKFEVQTKFRVPADAAVGSGSMTGKLRYQACTDKECLPPKTIDVHLPVEIQ